MSTNVAEVSAASIRGIEDAKDARPLLDHKCLGIPRESLYLLGPTSSTASTRRATAARHAAQPPARALHRAMGTGYVSILPVDQGIEHSGGGLHEEHRVLRPRADREARDRGRCNAVASTLGVLGPWPAGTRTGSRSS